MRIIKREQDKKKSPFEATKLIDTPDMKMIEARYNSNPFFIGIAVAKQREVKGVGQVGMEGVKGEYQSQKDLAWQLFYNMSALPSGFMPQEKLNDYMAGTVSLLSGSATVYSGSTKFIKRDPVTINDVIKDPMGTYTEFEEKVQTTDNRKKKLS